MKSSVLVVVAVWISLVAGRRLSTRSVLDNEIDLADSRESDRSRNWVTITPPKGEIKVLYGETVELECEASGSPPPTIQFYRDANDLTKNEIFSNEIVNLASTGLAKAKARFRFVAKKTEVIFCKATSGSKTSHVAFRVFVSG
ncbi:Immunoglobulin, partial [Oryctes borbonicus]